MKAWLKALLSETLLSLWWILSGLSTLSTFFFRRWAGEARLALMASAIVGFAWANYRVFQKQQAEILALRENSQLHPPRVSDLRITSQEGSRYILRPISDNWGDFNAMFLEFHLMIENCGGRNSIVNDFQIEIIELNRKFTKLAPQEGLTYVQGRHCAHGMNPEGLSKTGLIKVEPENTTDRGKLTFYIPEVNLRAFTECNLRMEGPQRKFPPLHCRLTLTDTTQLSATETFEMREE